MVAYFSAEGLIISAEMKITSGNKPGTLVLRETGRSVDQAA